MANAADIRCRLCLVTPPVYSPDAFAPQLAAALAGGDVATLIVTAPEADDPAALQAAVAAFVPICAERGVATIVAGDPRIAMRTGADGVHVEGGIDALRDARETLGDGRIVGAGGLRTRHDAMQASEAGIDYLFFGRLDGDTGPDIFHKAQELAAWWSEVTVVPAIVMGGNSLASVEGAAADNIAFVALSAAVWNDPLGPAAAVAEAVRRLTPLAEPAA